MIILFDIDGVLADCSERLKFIKQTPKDYDSFFGADHILNDRPIVPGLALLASLLPKAEIHLVTGRPERTRAATVQWLRQHICPTSFASIQMRKDGDYRPAFQVKKELVESLAAQMAIDDDPKNCRMYVELGIPALLFMSEHSDLWEF